MSRSLHEVWSLRLAAAARSRLIAVVKFLRYVFSLTWRPAVILILLLGAIASFLLPGFLTRVRSGEKPALGSGSPESIDLIIREEHVASITNPEALLTLIRDARPVPAHRCSFQGRLVFHYTNESIMFVPILPGHTNANYELRCTNGYFSVPRPVFMSILASAGVDTNKLPTK